MYKHLLRSTLFLGAILFLTGESNLENNSLIFSTNIAMDTPPIFINDFLVNDDSVFSDQSRPEVAIDNGGNFIIAWDDDRNGFSNIYAQRYSANGGTIGSNFRVDDADYSSTYYPDIATDSSGGFIIAWTDLRNGNSDIFAQRYSADGFAIGSNFLVNDDGGNSNQEVPAIAIDETGGFVICWEDFRNGRFDVYAQKYSSDGTTVGNNFLVNSNGSENSADRPAIAINDSGAFIIVWEGSQAIYAQRFSYDGTAIEDNILVTDGGYGEGYRPAIAIDGEGSIVMCWNDFRNGDSDIYAQRYSSEGSIIGNNFMINDDDSNSAQINPAISVNEEGNFVICWIDDQYLTTQITGRAYRTNGTPVDSSFTVNIFNITMAHYEPTCALAGDRLISSWQAKTVPGLRYDVFANIYSNMFDYAVPVEDIYIVTEHVLHQNYPNPFNPSTTIQYDLPEHSEVSLIIYDITGRTVQTLVSRSQASGSYEIVWNGRNRDGEEVAGGMYFARLRASEYSSVVKMVYLK